MKKKWKKPGVITVKEDELKQIIRASAASNPCTDGFGGFCPQRFLASPQPLPF